VIQPLRRALLCEYAIFWGLKPSPPALAVLHCLTVHNGHEPPGVPGVRDDLDGSVRARRGRAGVVLGMGGLLSALDEEHVAHGEPR
jgi:hypothetical protein